MSLRNSAQVRKHLLYLLLKVVLLKFVTSRNLILTYVFKFKFSIVNRVSDRVRGLVTWNIVMERVKAVVRDDKVRRRQPHFSTLLICGRRCG